MSDVTLTIGLLLPWLAGIAVVAALPGRRAPSAPGELAWLAGSGFLAGAFLLTLWMRALSFAGVAFGWLAIAVPLALLAAWRGYGCAAPQRERVARGRFRGALRAVASPKGLAGITRYAWWALITWLALRFLLLALQGRVATALSVECLDAMGHEGPRLVRARAHRPLRGESSPGSPPKARSISTPRRASPQRCRSFRCGRSIALGRWDDALMNWPWWQIAVALTFAVYGAMRALGLPALAALAAAFLVASLPLANVHVALAGYGDLPLAAYYTCAVLALLRFAALRDPRDAVLVALLALACTQIRTPWARMGGNPRSRPHRDVFSRSRRQGGADPAYRNLVRDHRARAVAPTLFGHPAASRVRPEWVVGGRRLLPARLLESVVVRRVASGAPRVARPPIAGASRR